MNLLCIYTELVLKILLNIGKFQEVTSISKAIKLEPFSSSCVPWGTLWPHLFSFFILHLELFGTPFQVWIWSFMNSPLQYIEFNYASRKLSIVAFICYWPLCLPLVFFIYLFFDRQQDHVLRSAKKEGACLTYTGSIHRNSPRHTSNKDGLH